MNIDKHKAMALANVPDLLGIEGMTFFGGLWHRPTSYPSDKVRGKCVGFGCLVWVHSGQDEDCGCGGKRVDVNEVQCGLFGDPKQREIKLSMEAM